MERYVALVKDEVIIIQSADYIEHGCFVEVKGKTVTLYEIPYGGGTVIKIGDFDSIIEALEYSKTLT